jgi:phosphohistidine phosphatase SixA
MKLLLMRHAHTEQGADKPDFERILTEQGQAEAMQAATFLYKQKIDKMIVSYVRRTMQTADVIQEIVPISEIEVVTELYNGKLDEVISLLVCQENIYTNVLVLGHNPLIYNLALELADNNSSEFEFLIQSSMPTARVIVIDFPTMNSWKELKNHPGNIIEIFTPGT